MVTIMRRLAPIPQAILLQREELAKDKGFIPFRTVDDEIYYGPDELTPERRGEIDRAFAATIAKRLAQPNTPIVIIQPRVHENCFKDSFVNCGADNRAVYEDITKTNLVMCDDFASPDWEEKGATTEIDPAMNQSRFEELYGCNFKSENDGR